MSGTGVKVQVKVDTAQLSAALRRLQATGGDALVTVALKNIGEILLNSTRRRFDEEKGPDGRAWAPLNPAYKGTAADRSTKGKNKGRVTTKGVKRGTKILQESGQLFASLRYQVDGNVLVVGTNKIYAAAQQFGATIVPRKANALVFWLGGRLIHAKKVTIPARPFLGLSAGDRERALEATEEIYKASWTGSP